MDNLDLLLLGAFIGLLLGMWLLGSRPIAIVPMEADRAGLGGCGLVMLALLFGLLLLALLSGSPPSHSVAGPLL